MIITIVLPEQWIIEPEMWQLLAFEPVYTVYICYFCIITDTWTNYILCVIISDIENMVSTDSLSDRSSECSEV